MGEEKPENIEEIVIEKEKQKEEPPKQIEEKDQEKETQAKAYIEVPFICQAPLQTEKNWTRPVGSWDDFFLRWLDPLQ